MAFEKNLIMPGEFSPGTHVSTDDRRCEFDLKNDLVLHTKTPVDIVLIGDSITHFFDDTIFLHNFGVVLNRGIGGDEAQFVAWRFDADVIQLKPKLCISLVGINNTWTLETNAGENGRYNEKEVNETINVIRSSYITMLDKAKEANIDMWIASVLPVGVDTPNYQNRNLLVIRINEMLRSLADNYNTKYVDYHAAFVKNDGLTMQDGISREGCHPNGKGYTIMSSVLVPMLNDYFKS